MTAFWQRLLTLGFFTAMLTGGAAGQRFDAPSFVFARYASASATALYAGRGFGAVGGLVAMVQNPKTQYRELVAGGFTRLSWGRQGVVVAVAYADASDARYAQVYLNPELVAGPVAFSATVEWYAPLEAAGTRQLSVNPASVVVRVAPRVALGVASTGDVAPGDALRWRLGPAAEWNAKWGTLRVEVLDRSSDKKTEIRTGVFAAF